jgi:hypothetical protein
MPSRAVRRGCGAHPRAGWRGSSAGSDHKPRDLSTAVQTLSASASRAGIPGDATERRCPASPRPSPRGNVAIPDKASQTHSSRSIQKSRGRPGTLATQNCKLVARRNDLELQFDAAAKATSEPGKERRDICEHVGDSTARQKKSLDFSTLAEFLLGTGESKTEILVKIECLTRSFSTTSVLAGPTKLLSLQGMGVT